MDKGTAKFAESYCFGQERGCSWEGGASSICNQHQCLTQFANIHTLLRAPNPPY